VGVAHAAAAVVLLGSMGLARAEVDWARGLVTANGLGIADRHAPTPASAREPARRAAEEAARAKLTAALPSLPLASGGTLQTRLADPNVKARIERAVASAITVDSIPQTDGSWKVVLAVPIEAVRQALAGPRAFATSDVDPAIVIVEGNPPAPAVGYTVGGVAAAAVWVTEIPKWAKGAPRVKATAARSGAIELDAKQGGPSTLFVIVGR